MKRIKNRIISLVLAMAMALSAGVNGAWAAELVQESDGSAVMEDASSQGSVSDLGGDESTELPAEEENSEESAQADGSQEETVEESVSEAEEEGTGAQESTEEVSQAPAEEETSAQVPQEESEGMQEDADSAQEEEELAPLEEEQPQPELTIAETVELGAEYDDRFTFSSVKDGYVVAEVTQQSPTSHVVEKGKVTSSRDKEVLDLNGNDAVATATGTATVLMVKESELSAAKALIAKDANATQSVEAVQVNVTVSPAPLTLMFLAGQSNMEGYGSYTGSGKKEGRYYQHPEQSIVCPEGEVYSTYAPGESAYRGKRANGIGGNVSFKGWCSASSANAYVAGSLTSNGNYITGKTLVYPINQLTAAGNGKNGPDSGLAYEWNRLTGDKVWTVNAAWGGSSSAQWVPGGKCYNRALAVFKLALQTYKAEIEAGHYKQSQKLYFWLQGETDGQTNVKANKYLSNFGKMRKGMKSALGFKELGIISVRASLGGHYKNAKDIAMTGPRIAQTYLSNTKAFSDVHIVSDVNERWVSDAGVKGYFQSVYGSSLSYPTHGKKPALPTKVSQVHNDIHFLQVAHNENGLTAARGMYQILSGTAQAKGVNWRDGNGKNIKSLSMDVGKTTTLSPAVDCVCAAKQVSWRFSSGLKYDAKSATLKRTKAAAQKIEAVAGGQVIATLNLPAANLVQTPVLKSAANVKGKKLKMTWTKCTKVTGYEIHYATNANFSDGKSVKVKKPKTVTATLKGLKAKTTYYVRVRGLNGSNTSGWSSVKTVAIKK